MIWIIPKLYIVALFDGTARL